MEAEYTTNKQKQPDSLLAEKRETFKRVEPFLDLETLTVDDTEKRRQEAIPKIIQLNPDSLRQVLELIRKFG